MSLILDALNRSRGSSHDIPTLATQHSVESVRSEGRQYAPWVVLAVARRTHSPGCCGIGWPGNRIHRRLPARRWPSLHRISVVRPTLLRPS